MSGGVGVLGFFAHPDDETLGAGGLLAAAAEAGREVTVVTATRGERGEVIPPDLAHLEGDGPALARHREQELADALQALGVRHHHFLDEVPGSGPEQEPSAPPERFTDSGMSWLRPGVAGPAPEAGPDSFSTVDLEHSAQLLARALRHYRPGLLLTEEPGGGYGHPDHVRAHRVAMRAVELCPVPVVAWHVRAEEPARRALRWLAEEFAREPQRGVRGEVLATMDPDGELPSFVVPESEVDLTVETTHVLPAVAQAMRAHRSQVQNVHLDVAGSTQRDVAGWFALSNGVAQPILRTTGLHLAPILGGVTQEIATQTGATVPELAAFFADAR